MTDPVDPIRPPEPPRRTEIVSDRRSGRERRRRFEAEAEAAPARTAAPAEPPPCVPEDLKAGPTQFYAQLLGGGPRRGLKGGPETLEEARHTYLENEFSGPSDRRPPKARAIDDKV